MPVRVDNIDPEKLAKVRAQGRARQAKLAARKKAERAADLRPRPQDLDEALVRSLLATEKTDIIATVVRGAFERLKATGYQNVKPALQARCTALRPDPKPPTPSFTLETASPNSTPCDTPVTPTDANPHPADRIADPTPA